MPKLPIPDLKDTLSQYKEFVRAIVEDDEAYAKTVAAVESFAANEGPKLHDALLAWDKENPGTSYIAGFWYDMYLDNRDAFPLNLTPQLSWKLHADAAKNEQAVRAADLCRAAARFYVSYQNRTLLPDVFHTKPEISKHPLVESFTSMLPSSVSYYAAYAAGAYPLDMSQYSRLFCSTRIPVARGRDELRSVEHSSYAAVFVGTHVYKLQLFEDAEAASSTPASALGIKETGTGRPENLRPLAAEAIETQLRAIQADAASRKPVPPVAALTTMHRDEWGDARASMEQHPVTLKGLEEIDGALFALSLDDAKPDTHEDLSECMLAGKGRNRWFDKSFNLIVCANGRSGIAWEHAWGDGVAVLNFFNEVHDATSKEPSRPKSKVPDDLTAVVRRIEFDGMPDDVVAAIRKAEADHDRIMSECDIDVYRTPSLNKEDIKQAKLSPDGIMQMVLQLAHHKAHGYVPSTYESASTAGFKHGRTETIRSASPEAAAMVRCFANPSSSAKERVASLEAAVDRHSKTSRLALMGKGVDRHLFALRKHAELQGMDMPAIFTDDSYLKMGDIRMSTSTLSSPALDGGGFGPVSRTSYGIGYGNDSRGVQFHVASYGLGNDKFLDCIEDSLRDLRAALEEVRGGPLSNRPETAVAPGELRSKREVAKGI